MFACTIKDNLKVNCLINKLNNLIYSIQYPAIIGALAVIFYILDIPMLGISVLGLLGALILLCFRDFTPFLPPLLFSLFTISDFSVLHSFPPFIIYGIVFVCFVAHFFIYPIKKIVAGKLTAPIIVLSIVMFLSGVLSSVPKNLSISFVLSFTIGPLMLIIYLVYSSYINSVKSYDILEYFSLILVAIALTGGIQVSCNVLDCRFNMAQYSDYVGWANVNTVATVILLCIPANWYLLLRKKNFAFNSVTLILLYIVLTATRSDACMGFAFVTLPIIAFFTYKKADTDNLRNLQILFNIIICALAIGVSIFVFIYNWEEIQNIILKHLRDSGRSVLYRDAFHLFIENPVFGVGLGYYPEDIENTTLVAYNFHSVIFHSMATMGVFGLLSYIYYYIKRIQIVTHSHSRYNLYAVVFFIYFFCYSLIDTCEFNSMPIMMIVTFIFCVIEYNNTHNCSENLPLVNTKIKFN